MSAQVGTRFFAFHLEICWVPAFAGMTMMTQLQCWFRNSLVKVSDFPWLDDAKRAKRHCNCFISEM